MNDRIEALLEALRANHATLIELITTALKEKIEEARDPAVTCGFLHGGVAAIASEADRLWSALDAAREEARQEMVDTLTQRAVDECKRKVAEQEARQPAAEPAGAQVGLGACPGPREQDGAQRVSEGDGEACREDEPLIDRLEKISAEVPEDSWDKVPRDTNVESACYPPCEYVRGLQRDLRMVSGERDALGKASLERFRKIKELTRELEEEPAVSSASPEPRFSAEEVREAALWWCRQKFDFAPHPEVSVKLMLDRLFLNHSATAAREDHLADARKMVDLDFGQALAAMREGKRVRRPTWQNRDLCLFWDRERLWGTQGPDWDGGRFSYRADDQDLAATDWQLVPDDHHDDLEEEAGEAIHPAHVRGER